MDAPTLITYHRASGQLPESRCLFTVPYRWYLQVMQKRFAEGREKARQKRLAEQQARVRRIRSRTFPNLNVHKCLLSFQDIEKQREEQLRQSDPEGWLNSIRARYAVRESNIRSQPLHSEDSNDCYPVGVRQAVMRRIQERKLLNDKGRSSNGKRKR